MKRTLFIIITFLLILSSCKKIFFGPRVPVLELTHVILAVDEPLIKMCTSQQGNFQTQCHTIQYRITRYNDSYPDPDTLKWELICKDGTPCFWAMIPYHANYKSLDDLNPVMEERWGNIINDPNLSHVTPEHNLRIYNNEKIKVEVDYMLPLNETDHQRVVAYFVNDSTGQAYGAELSNWENKTEWLDLWPNFFIYSNGDTIFYNYWRATTEIQF